MDESLGEDSDDALEALREKGVGKSLARRAIEMAQTQGRLTVFSVVDALTRLSGELPYAGERLEADLKAASFLKLVSA